MAQFSKKEAARLERELKHLQQNFSGVENMTTLPDVMFVIDPNAEVIAVHEARRMGIPVVAIVDTNCDPDLVDWVIPGNDDALRAIRLFTSKISDAVIVGRQTFEQTQIADQKAAEGAAAKKAWITWTRAPTKFTKSRKAISWKASRAIWSRPKKPRQQPCRPRTRHISIARQGGSYLLCEHVARRNQSRRADRSGSKS